MPLYSSLVLPPHCFNLQLRRRNSEERIEHGDFVGASQLYVTGGNPEQPPATSARPTLTVVRADGLPHLRTSRGKERKFYVTATDGTKTEKTLAIRSRGWSVQWDGVLSGFTVTSSSRLIVSVFACRTWPHADLPLHGAVVIPLESLRAISLQSFDLIVHPTGTTTLVLSIDLPGTSSQRMGTAIVSSPRAPVTSPQDGRVLGEAGGSGAPPDVSMEDQVHSAEVASSSAKKAMDNLKGTKDSISQTMQIADKAPGDLEEVVGLYDTWAPALNNVKQVVDIVDKIAEVLSIFPSLDAC
ncbi:hypothetical protein BC834DRAFT_644319 [Gloeopeniophorella convolvens]|nr:hypothetical protein BC834DRAFT_644319 [Gloeopeniophorella convolvens]